MSRKEPDDSRIVSVRLPDDLIQRLDRSLDWRATHQRLPSTRNAAMREALSAWLDQQEQLAGLLEPQALRRQFQATYNSIRPPETASPSSSYASCCGGLGSGSMPSWRPFELIIKLISRPSRSMPSTPQLPKTATMPMANAMSGSDGAIERGLPVPHGLPPRTDQQPSPRPSHLATIGPLSTPQS